MMDFCANTDRMVREFVELTGIDSVSFREREMADRLKGKLAELGVAVTEDEAGEAYGGNAGNLYGFLPGELPGEPILLSAHMDTVEPGLGKKAVGREDGRITSGGDTVLGADDVCGLVEILEAVRCLREKGIPHRSVEVLFPIGEELFIKGTNRFDFSKIRAKEAYILDLSGEVGSAALRAPSLISFTVTVRGKAAHAGFAPEAGVHAVRLMSLAIGKLPMGRIGGDTTLNIGMIQGGGMVNIVPELCVCKGEIRSYSHEKALEMLKLVEKIFQEVIEGTGAQLTVEHTVDLYAYEIKKDEPVVKRFEAACRSLGREPVLTETFGGSDNNNFVRFGVRGIVISCGMYQCHSVEEYTKVEELKAGAELVARLLTI